MGIGYRDEGEREYQEAYRAYLGGSSQHRFNPQSPEDEVEAKPLQESPDYMGLLGRDPGDRRVRADAEKGAYVLALEQEQRRLRAELLCRDEYAISLEREVQALKVVVAVKATYGTALERKVKNLKGWIDDLQSGMYINCAYCGHQYGPAGEAPVTRAEELEKHIEQCPDHPMSALRERCEELRVRLDELEFCPNCGLEL